MEQLDTQTLALDVLARPRGGQISFRSRGARHLASDLSTLTRCQTESDQALTTEWGIIYRLRIETVGKCADEPP
jgi:hypothetical protein